jgi:ABC-2 type transport system ATP-binding protein
MYSKEVPATLTPFNHRKRNQYMPPIQTTPATPLVEIQNLTKQFKGRPIPAVNDISFSIRKGEIFSLLGPNGAGKTTLISMLSCLLKPTTGDATVAGYSITRQPAEVKKRIGVVPQDVAVYPALTATENLMFWGQMYGMGGNELKQRTTEILDILGLSDRATDKVETYSGGMKRRINLGVGLLHRPELLFLDEPTVAIDPQSRRNILDLVLELNRAGMTILYTTHYMEEAQELSHRVGIMDNGALIALGTQEELTQQVGEYDTLRLTVEGDNPALLETVSTLPDVVQVSAEENHLTLLTPSANRLLPTLLEPRVANGAKFTRIEIEEPNLESLFLHLTGRALRD